MLPLNIKSVDSFCLKTRKELFFDYPLAKYVLKYKRTSVLHSKFGKTGHFTTGQFRFASKKQIPIDSLYKIYRDSKLNHSYGNCSQIYQDIRERYLNFRNYFTDFVSGYTRGVSPLKMWNLSIVSALIFGMFLMTFIYRYLGQDALARSDQLAASASLISQAEKIREPEPAYPGLVLGKETESNDNSEEADNYVADIIRQYQEASQNQEKSQEKIKEMVKGYPIEQMVPYISEEDPVVAAFMISIAKKESAWGKHSPVLDSQDCFNYWGYRGIRKRMGSGGHTCFDSRQDAVKTVAKRIKSLVYDENINTPGKMVTVWKCGYDCSWDDPRAVKKWIADVDMYFKEFDNIDA